MAQTCELDIFPRYSIEIKIYIIQSSLGRFAVVESDDSQSDNENSPITNY